MMPEDVIASLDSIELVAIVFLDVQTPIKNGMEINVSVNLDLDYSKEFVRHALKALNQIVREQHVNVSLLILSLTQQHSNVMLVLQIQEIMLMIQHVFVI